MRGRDSELAFLHGLVEGAGAGVGAAVLVEGEQGAGKSALLRAGLTGAEEAGLTVWWESASEVDERFPLRLVTGSGDPVPALVEQLLSVVDRKLAAGPVLLVAENLQWADGACVATWRRLSQAANQLPLLLAGSVRPGSGRNDLDGLRLGLLAHRGTVLTLQPLGTQEIANLVRDVLGGTPGPLLADVLRQAAGNPLYACELAEALLREGRIRVVGQVAELADGSARFQVPASLTAALQRRLRGLPPDVLPVLRKAALLGPEFPVLDLEALTGLTAGELMGVVEAGVAAGVLTSAGRQLGFRHALIRRHLYAKMPDAERAGAHLRAARSLAAAGAPAERVATQLVFVLGGAVEAAAMGADSAEAWVPDWLAEQAVLLSYRAPEASAELLRAVLRQLPETDPRAAKLAANLVTVAFLLMQDDEVEETGGSLLKQGGDPVVIAEIAWLVAFSRLRAGRLAEGLATVDQALLISVGGELRTARLLALRALFLVGLRDFGEAARVAETALAEAERTGDRLGAGYALHAVSKVESSRPDGLRRLSCIDRALLIAADDPQAIDLRVTLLGDKASELARLGQQAAAISAGQQTLKLAEQMGARRVRIIRASLGQLYYEAGRWDDAVAELGLVTPGAEPDRVDHLASAVLALILARRNHWDEARIRLDHVPDVPQGSTPPWAGTRSLLLARALRAERWGRTGEAVAALRPCLDASLPDELPGRHRLLATLVRLALAAGDTGTAVAAANAAARDAAFGRTALGAIVAAHCRGLLAGDPESVLAAAGDFEAAGQPLEQAQALADAAVLAAVRHELPSARQALAVATAVYDSLEAQWDAQCIAARLRQYGVRQYGVRHGRVGRQRRSATGWGALTPAELKIAYLIAAGRSNPDIAAELYLSRNTVQTHVSHILAKLGARSRTEIVGVAADNPQAAST